jgi:hypothetical protein
MAPITKLQQELAQATRHIVDARARMARQLEIMRRLEADGHDAAQAKNLFRDLEDSLEEMLAHREHIVRELSRAEGCATFS